MTKNINYEALPPHMRGGMQRYIEQRIPTGSFLEAILANDLVESYKRADDINREAIPSYVAFLLSSAPIACWGSYEKVQKWIDDKEK